MRVGLWLSCLYLFTVYFRPQELYPALQQIPSLMDWLGAIALLATLLDILVGSRPSFRQPQIWLLLFFLLWAGFSVAANSLWLGGAWGAFHELSINAFVFFVVVLHGSERRRLDVLRMALVAALLATVVFGLRAYYLGPRQPEFVLMEGLPESAPADQGAAASAISRLTESLTGRWQAAPAAPADGDEEQGEEENGASRERPRVPRLRALGLLNDPNDLAQTLVAALPLVFLAWRRSRPVGNLILVLLPTAAILWAVLLTRSRGGLVALVSLAWFAVALRAGHRWERPMRWLGVAGLLAVMVVFYRLGAADESAMGRLDAWSAGLQMLKQSPVWGVGFGSFADVNGLVAHNSFVHCFSELGVVGYAAWLGTIVASLWYLERIRSCERAPGQAEDLARWAGATELSFVGFLTAALFLSRTYSVSLFLLIGLATALAGVAGATARAPDQYALPAWKLAFWTGSLLAASLVAVYAVLRLAR